jgi:puromycin-sensitive aminopeptidase
MRLHVRQERFFADRRAPAAKRRTHWPLPLVAKWPDGDRVREERFLVDRPRATLTIPGAVDAPWCWLNVAAEGFYRTQTDRATRTAVLRDVLGTLTAAERLALIGDDWALVRAGRTGIATLLDVVDALGEDPDHDVLGGVAAVLTVLAEQVPEQGSPLHHALQRWVASRFRPSFDRLGWETAADEDDAVRARRSALLRLVGGVAEATDILAEARVRLLPALLDEAALDGNLADIVVDLAGRVGDEDLWARYRAVAATAHTPQRRRRFLLGLASFRTPELVQRTLEAVLLPDVPAQDVTFVLARLFHNPVARQATWRFVTQHWTALGDRVSAVLLGRLIETTPALREPRFARELARFFRSNPLAEGTRSVKQALETFRLHADLRRRTAPGLRAWLADAEPTRAGARAAVRVSTPSAA